MDKRLITVSKYLSKYLRHAPQELGLTLQPGGWVPVDDLLNAAEKNGFPISHDELVDCVETNDKHRFAFDVSGELIRANQGHSVEVDLQLEDVSRPRRSTTGRSNGSCRRSSKKVWFGGSATTFISRRTWRRPVRLGQGEVSRSYSRSMPRGCTGTVTSSGCRQMGCG